MSEEELNFDDLVDIAITHIYRDNECSALQKIVKKQQKEIEELKQTSIIDLEKYKENNVISVLGKEYISKDKIREKIKEYMQDGMWKYQNAIDFIVEELLEEK